MTAVIVDNPHGQVGVGSGIGHKVRLQRGDASILRGARLVPHHVRMPLSVGEDGFLPLVFHPNGTARPPRQQTQEDLDRHVFLASEPSAHIAALDSDPAVGNLESLRHVAVVFEHLGADEDVDDLAFVYPGHAGLGLQIGVVDELRRKLVLDDHVRFAESGFHIPLSDRPLTDEISAIVHLRGIRPQSLQRVKDAGQGFVVDLDPRQRLLGRGRALGGDQRHGFAQVADAICREDLMEGLMPLFPGIGHAARKAGEELVLGHILCGEDAHDARHPESRLLVDSANPRGGVLGVEDATDQGAAREIVRRIAKVAPGFVHGVMADHPAPERTLASPSLHPILDCHASRSPVRCQTSHPASMTMAWPVMLRDFSEQR